jgi:hypothetical protein
VTTGWRPGIRRHLLPGASAHWWAVLEWWALGVCFGSLGVAVALWLLHYDLWSLPFYLISAIALLVRQTADPFERLRTRKEILAGYTSLKKGPTDVELVDIKSDQIIRFANEVISDDELKVRIRTVRGEVDHTIG